MLIWQRVLPLVAIVSLAASWGRELPLWLLACLGAVLVAAVLSAVHHAEVVAHRVGEPFGSLVLAVAVTVIEVALIVTIMTAKGEQSATLARDTVFSAIMITCNGIVGAAVLTRTLRGGVARFNAAGAGAGLASISLLATLVLVLPTVTRSVQGPVFTPFQLAFVAVASLTIYLLFVFVQTVRHRNYFLPPAQAGESKRRAAERPSNARAMESLALLLVCLVSVVGLAKATTPLIETMVVNVGLPLAAVAVVIALLVLLPESIAAVRAARRDRFQISMNLAYGSAMASIGLTIPTIAVASWLFDLPLVLGLSPTEITLLAITVATGILTVTPGRATLLQGGVHLCLFAAFLALVLNP